MGCTVEAVSDRRTLNDFLNLPSIVYRDDPRAVLPVRSSVKRVLDVRANPYFESASLDMFVVYREGRPVSRAVLVVSREHCRTFNERTGFFGFFESLDDREGAEALFSRIEGTARAQNVTALEGPFNPNHYSELGLLADHYDEEQGFFEPYNPPYYHRLLGEAGFVPTERLYTGRNDAVGPYLRKRYGPVPDPPARGDYTVRMFDLSRMDRDLECVRTVFNDAFAGNWHFLPASEREHRFSAKYLKLITEPRLVTIVEHRGTPAGVLMCVLDVNPLLRRMHGSAGPVKYVRFLSAKKRIRTLVVYAVGIRKGYRGTRVFTLLMDSLRRMADSFDVLTCTWIHPENVLSVKTAARVGLTPFKHLLIYRKDLPRSGGGIR